jgi:hypothetical protein
VFQVTVWFRGQPVWTAGEYPTRAAAAHAAADLVRVGGPKGELPFGVGLVRTDTPHEPRATLMLGSGAPSRPGEE